MCWRRRHIHIRASAQFNASRGTRGTRLLFQRRHPSRQLNPAKLRHRTRGQCQELPTARQSVLGDRNTAVVHLDDKAKDDVAADRMASSGSGGPFRCRALCISSCLFLPLFLWRLSHSGGLFAHSARRAWRCCRVAPFVRGQLSPTNTVRAGLIHRIRCGQ